VKLLIRVDKTVVYLIDIHLLANVSCLLWRYIPEE